MTSAYLLSIIVPSSALICYGALATMMARRYRESGVHRFFLIYLIAMIAWSGASLMLRLDAANALRWNRIALIVGGVVMPLTWFMFGQSFLGRNPWNRRILPGVLIAIVLIVATPLGYMVQGIETDAQGRVLMQFGPARPLYALYWVTYVFWSAAILRQAYRGARDPAWRNRIRYPMIGTLLVLLGGVTNAIGSLSQYPLDIAANLVNALLLAYAIARYQLMDVAQVMRRALSWAVGAIVIAAVYALSLFLLYQVFQARWTGFIVIGLAFSIVMFAANPALRARAQFWVDQALFHERYDLRQMLQEVSRVATRLRPLPELAELLLVRVRSTLGLKHAVFLAADETSERVSVVATVGPLAEAPALKWQLDHPLLIALARHDRPMTNADLDLLPQMRSLWAVEKQELDGLRGELFVPVLANGRLLAALALGGKWSGEPFSNDDVTALSTLANQTAVAIDNARLYHKVQRDAAELEHANAELRELDRLKDEFIQNMSHELRTPLTFVQGYVELMQEEELGPLTPEQRAALATVMDRSKAIVHLVNDIISLTKDRRDLLQVDHVDLTDVIERSVKAAWVVAENAHITLRWEVDARTPLILGDARRLGQVLDNLLGNAIKFSPNGGEVFVQAAPLNGEVRVTVTDHGIGIPPAELPRIWDRFYQVDGSSTRRYGGSGLGLTIVKRIVEAHGGRIWVDSAPDQGSTFICALPIGGPLIAGNAG
jgi:signal transduction histidine kinase